MEKEINISKSGIIEEKVVASIVLILSSGFLYFLLTTSNPNIVFKTSPTKIILIGLYFICSLCIYFSLIHLFTKKMYKIVYNDETITFFNEGYYLTINIADIYLLEGFPVDYGDYKTKIYKVYLSIMTIKNEEMNISSSKFHHEELLEMYKHIKKINPQIKDDFFKNFKYGLYTPSCTFEEYKEKGKKRFDLNRDLKKIKKQ